MNIDTLYESKKLWSFGTDMREMKDIFVSKLQITENHRKLDVSENNKVIYDFQENELHEGNVMLLKLK